MSQQDKDSKKSYPLLPLRDVIIFPHMVVPLFVGREKSIAALEEASLGATDSKSIDFAGEIILITPVSH